MGRQTVGDEERAGRITADALTVTGAITAGSVANPTFTGTTTAGSAIFTGSTSGNLVRITQTGAGNALVVEDSANPDSTAFTIAADGKVTIANQVIAATGAYTPASIGFDPYVVVAGDGNQAAYRADGFGSPGRLVLERSAGTMGTQAVVASGDGVGEIRFSGSDGTGFIRAAVIAAAVDGTPGTNDMPGRLVFSTTADGASTPTERMRIDSNGLITGTGTSLGAWTSYTPTLGGTGWAIGNGTIEGRYTQTGKVVHFRIYFALGSTTTYGASTAPTFTLPVTASGTRTLSNASWVSLQDTSVGATYLGRGDYSSTTVITVSKIGADGIVAAVTATAPFTWDTGDIIRVAGTYEIA